VSLVSPDLYLIHWTSGLLLYVLGKEPDAESRRRDPQEGKNAGRARPLKQQTSYRNRPISVTTAIPRGYMIDLDDGVDPFRR
jgi:hypothetical protein